MRSLAVRCHVRCHAPRRTAGCIAPGRPKKRWSDARLRAPAAARRDHHGRQRPLGRRPPPAARRRAPRRHRRGARSRSRPRRGWASRSSRSTRFPSRTGSGRTREISALMGLLKHYLRARAEDAAQEQHPVPRHRPARSAEPRDPRGAAAAPKSARRANTGMQFNIALSYGGRAEIVDAARRAIRSGHRSRRARRNTRSPRSSTRPASPIPIC